MARFAYPRSVRIRRSEDYRRIQREGRRLRSRHLVVLVRESGLEHSRYGLVVSRKVGNAVTRNRVKRWLREAIRHERAASSADDAARDVVFIARPPAAQAGQAVLREEVGTALGRIGAGR